MHDAREDVELFEERSPAPAKQTAMRDNIVELQKSSSPSPSSDRIASIREQTLPAVAETPSTLSAITAPRQEEANCHRSNTKTEKKASPVVMITRSSANGKVLYKTCGMCGAMCAPNSYCICEVRSML